jgi:hypothetical protein
MMIIPAIILMLPVYYGRGEQILPETQRIET